MNKLKSPAAWIGFLCGVCALLMLPGGPVPAKALPWIGVIAGILGLAGSWFFDAPAPKPPTGPALALLFALGLSGCATINPVLCGANGHLVPPAAGPCAQAFLDAVAAVPGEIAACKVGFTSACIDAVIASGRELTACLPTCAPNTATGKLGVGAPVKVAPNVLRQNVIDSLRATGHATAGR